MTFNVNGNETKLSKNSKFKIETKQDTVYQIFADINGDGNFQEIVGAKSTSFESVNKILKNLRDSVAIDNLTLEFINYINATGLISGKTLEEINKEKLRECVNKICDTYYKSIMNE